jgi:DNA-binding SARP family transcriptional activator
VIEYRILGPVEALEEEGGRVALGGPKQRALLALLLLNAKLFLASSWSTTLVLGRPRR